MANAIRRVNGRAAVAGRAVVAWLAWLTVCAAPQRAGAHPEWSPLRVNRYCKLVLTHPGQLEVVYTILYGERPALAMRKAADRNADGRVDVGERDWLVAQAQLMVATGLRVRLDGKEAGLGAARADVGMAGDAVAPEPLSIDLSYRVAVDGRAHLIVLDDRVAVPDEGDSEVMVDDGGGPGRLLASGRGVLDVERQAAPTRTFTFRGPRFSALEDRTVSVRFVVPRARARWPWLLAVGLVPILVVGLWLGRARARRYRSMNG